MIRVTVELVSAVDPKRSKVLGVAKLVNDGVDSLFTAGDKGSYVCTFSKMEPKTKETWKKSQVKGFDRNRLGPWDLLYLGLRAAGMGLRNPDLELIEKVTAKVTEILEKRGTKVEADASP